MWKPTDRSFVVDQQDLMSATPDYGSTLSVSLGMFAFLEKVTMSDDQTDAEFLSYTFLSEDRDGNFQDKFSVTKFAKLWKVKGLIANGKIKQFIGVVRNGTIHFQAFSWNEYDKAFAEQRKQAKEEKEEVPA